MVKTLLNVKWLISMRFSWYFIYDVTYLSNDVTFRNALWSKMTNLGRKWTLKMEFLTVYFMKIIFQVFLLWIEHKVYIVNLSLRASDDVIMPFWSERVIVLTLLCLEVRGGTVRRLKEREKRKIALYLYTHEKIQINITTLVRLSVSGWPWWWPQVNPGWPVSVCCCQIVRKLSENVPLSG